MFGSTLNAVFFGLTAVLTVFHYFSLRKEFSYRRSTAFTTIFPLVLTMIMYALLLRAAPLFPSFVYFLLSGLLLGLLFGLLTKIYVKGGALYGKRSRFYLLLWSISVIFTQGTLKFLGTAAAGIGITLMFFPLGMALSQQAVLSLKAGSVRRRNAAAALGALFFVAVLLLPGAEIEAETNPFKLEKDAAHAYYLMAKDAYALGDYDTAIYYGHLVVNSTRSPGTKAKGYMVIYLSGGGENYSDLAYEGIVNSGQLKGLSREDRETAAVLIGQGIIDDIQNWQYQGYAIPPEENIISAEGIFAVSGSQLQALWENLKISALENFPLLGGIAGILDDFVDDIARSSSVSDGAAAASAAAASAIMILSSLLNIFSNKAELLPGLQPGEGRESMAAGGPQIADDTSLKTEGPVAPYTPDDFLPEEPLDREPEEYEPEGPEEAEGPKEPAEPEEPGEPEEPEEPGEPEEPEEPEEPQEPAKPQEPGGEGEKPGEEKGWLEQMGDFLEANAETAEWIKDTYTNFIDFMEHCIIAEINKQRTAIFEALNMKDPLEHAYWTGRGVNVSRVKLHENIKSLGNALWYFDVLNDALNNVGEGDSYLHGFLKSVGSNYLGWAVGETAAGPTVALYEAANWLLFGGSEVKDIVSHINTLKEGSNMLYDKIKDMINGTDETRKRLESGHYGRNLQNLHHGTEILAEWTYNEGQMAKDISDVVTDNDFYENMRETNRELWKPAEGSWMLKRGVLWLGEKAFEGWINIAEATKDTAQYLGEKSTRWF